jgi:hypothetical protein
MVAAVAVVPTATATLTPTPTPTPTPTTMTTTSHSTWRTSLFEKHATLRHFSPPLILPTRYFIIRRPAFYYCRATSALSSAPYTLHSTTLYSPTPLYPRLPLLFFSFVQFSPLRSVEIKSVLFALRIKKYVPFGTGQGFTDPTASSYLQNENIEW